MGANWGKLGKKFDVDAKHCQFYPDQVGPQESKNSRVLYCLIKWGASASVNLKSSNDHLMFDFAKAFSITVWIRPKGPGMIVGGNPQGNPSFLLWPIDQLSFFFGDEDDLQAISTHVEALIREEWKHLAVVYKPPLDLQFYVDGEKLPMGRELKKITGRQSTSSLTLWKRADGKRQFNGQMACLTIFQAAINQHDLQRHREFCPGSVDYKLERWQ